MTIIEISNKNDLYFCLIAKGSLVNDTTLPSGLRTPAKDMIIDGKYIRDITVEEKKQFEKCNN